ALLASTSTLVFGGLLGGVATADVGTIKVGGYPVDNSGNGNDPHVDTACVGIRMYDFAAGAPVTAVFSTQAPTRIGSTLNVTGTAATINSYDLKPWLSSLGTPAKQGFHISVTVNGKQ